MATKEESTKIGIENFMTPGASILILGQPY